jgi:hypothetical protein
MIPFIPKFTISNHQMPLAVYREVAAHLQQIEGIVVTFIDPKDRLFSYTESQLGGLVVTGADRLIDADKSRIDLLLRYYADRYNPWEIES